MMFLEASNQVSLESEIPLKASNQASLELEVLLEASSQISLDIVDGSFQLNFFGPSRWKFHWNHVSSNEYPLKEKYQVLILLFRTLRILVEKWKNMITEQELVIMEEDKAK
ncbi:hypothetical protein RCL_jg17652.t1 [Rhizophagus clarus]|uniref:Uncharacterized protein n=1 Tax=Rhizophagus clarus TaxID=94130 RepID=A0A8H3QIB9_9GLOM|nr:hypothetical protein RCL_jg17652.t1 [Rhizophagus clarus]